MSKPKSLRARLTLTTAMAGALLVSYGGRTSYAGTCVGAGGVYFCSGGAAPGEAGVSIDYGGPVTVTTSGASPAGFGIDTTGTGDTAISIKADGGLTFDDTNSYGSIITGDDDGLYAKNENGGALTITTKGPVTGLAGDGIEASNDADGTTVTISVASVAGGGRGIEADNLGTGDLTITATGPVSGGTGEGINANNQGGGSLIIDADGLVSSTGDDAIRAFNAGSVVDLTISAAGVSGADAGILAQNFGTGDLSVTTSGVVTGTNGNGITANNYNGGAVFVDASDTVSSKYATGISASNGGSGTGITITAAAVSGGEFGVDAVIFAPGSIDITTNGAVSGGTGSGIRARNYAGGSLSITANETVSSNDASGIFAQNAAGTNELTISAAAVSGGSHGVYAKNQGSGDLTVTTGGPVLGDNGVGVSARNYNGGAVAVTASDTVTSNKADGIFARNYAGGTSLTVSTIGVVADDNGISARNFGTGDLAITAGGTVTATNGIGIDGRNNLGGSLTINAEDTVISKQDIGILAINADSDTTDLTISAAGVSGQSTGIEAINNGTGNLSITAGGPVVGTTLDGINATNSIDGNNLTISAAGVDGGLNGIAAESLGTGDLTIYATDAVTGQTFIGMRARNFNGGAVSITTKVTVSGAFDGMYARNAAGGTSLTISAAGVSGGNFGIYAKNGGTGDLSVTADGTVTAGTGSGISAKNFTGGALTITANDAVSSSEAYGILAYNGPGTSGLTISAEAITSKNDGIAAKHLGSGDLVITANGAITSLALPGEQVDGIDVNNGANGANVTVTTAAVTGQQDGIDASNFGTGALSIFASGPVVGIDDEGIDAFNSDNGTNLTIEAADVSGKDKGIQAINNGVGELSITATGSVTGTTNEGIRALNDPSATNLTISAAAVSGGTHGIYAKNEGTGDLTITAGNVTGGLGGGGNGITANLGVSGDTLTISAASVSGADAGISARNDGTGDLSIATTGPVSGGSGYGIQASNYHGGAITITAKETVSSASIDGIRARNEEDTTDVTVDVAGVSGAVRGIDVRNVGTGNIDITATGMVTAGLRQGIEARNYNGGDISITAEDTVSSTDWDGISAKNNDGGGALTISAAEVSGGRSGIRAEHLGTGALSITAGGDVTGDTTEGIFALIDNAASGADLTISAMAVSGGTDGIDAENVGSGGIFVTTSGPVTGNGDGYGIRAENSAGGDVSIMASDTVSAIAGAGIAARNSGPLTGDITVMAAGVSGLTGIVANSSGSGSVSVTATGTVTGTGPTSAGITALNGAGTDIDISTVDVIGGARGITARNTGTGSTIIDADGTVTGLADTALYAYNGVNGGGITVSAMDVEGGGFGIFARSRGDGSISVTATGDVTGATSDGIRADAASLDAIQVTVAAQSAFGDQRGIDARNNGTGHLEVVAEGTATGGQREGIRARITNTASGGDLTVSAADVNGGTYGIVAENRGGGGLGVTAVGAVVGGTNDGIRATNTADGTDMTISAASVVGGAYGIFANNQGTGDLSVTTEGPVTAGIGDGIFAWNYNGGALSVTANDFVTSIDGEGIYTNNFAGSTSLTISAAGVSAGRYGIIGRNEGSGDFTVTATDIVASTIGAGIFAENLTGGALDITAQDDVVSENSVGINARNLVGTTDLTIEAAGIDAGKQAINALNEGTGDLSITANGPATSGAYGGIVARNYNGGHLTVSSSDSVSAASAIGIVARNNVGGGDLTITAAGVSGDTTGIKALNYGSGSLSVSAMGPVTGDGNVGILATNVSASSSDVTILADEVSGGFIGILSGLNGTGKLSVTATGTVTGGPASPDGSGISVIASNADNAGMTISAASVIGGQSGIVATNLGMSDIGITTTGAVAGGDATQGVGILARNLSDAAGDVVVSTVDVFGGVQGIETINDGIGGIEISSTGAITGGLGSGIAAKINNPNSAGDIEISVADVSGGTYGIAAENRGSGDLTVVTEGPVEGGTRDGMYLRNANGGALSVTATEHITSAELNGIRAVNYAGGSSMTVSTVGVSGFTGGIIATNAGTGDIAVTATGEVSGGPLGDGMRVRNLFGGSLSITTTELVSSGLSPVATGIFAENRAGGTDLSISTTDVFGNRNGITARHYGDGALNVTTAGSVTGATDIGIRAYNKTTGSNLTVSAASVSGGIDAIQVDHQGSGDLLVTVTGAISGGTGAGISNIDTLAQGGTIEVAETASVSAASGVAVMDGDGGTLLWSEGALAGDVMLNGGEDKVALFNGSATGLLGLGGGDDTMEIFGAGAGGGWDDADFSGKFDGNLGQVLQIDGSDGLDTVELFGVTAASQALGVPTELEALALSGNTLVQANAADLTPFGAVFVDPTSTLQAEGNSPSYTVVGSLGNEGVVDLADGEANDMLRVTGDYAGATGSQVLLDLDTDAGTSDTLIIEGDVTDVAVGPFTVIHDRSLIDVNLIGAGSRTTGDGIRLIEVSGAVDGDDFALTGPVEGGIFGYELAFEDGVHFLRSDFFDQIYLYENLPGAMQTIGLALTGQLVERVGVRSAVPSVLAHADGNPVVGGAPVDTAVWGRAVGLSVESEGDLDSITGTSFDQTVGFVQAGVDVTVLERQSGRLLIGALGHWGTSSLDANTFDGDDAGSADFDFYGGGLTATWYSTQGWYFDNVVQYTAYDIDISTASRFSTTSTDGYAITTSHEVGYRIPISETAALVPQAQLTYQHIDFDDFIDPDGVRISLDDGDSLIGRAGFAFENSAAIGSALATGYVEANLLHEFLGDNSVNVATGFGTTPISQETRGTSVELGFGGTVAVSRGVSLYGEVDYTIPFDNGVQGFQALGGIRVNLNPPPAPPPPAPVIAPVAETAFIVFFDWDRADLTSEANLVLDEVAVVANETGYASIRLDGYTDLSGSAAYNLGLSERRANSVANGLIARGIAPDEIVIRAFGEENPLVPTPDGVREPQNRRVEIFLS